ncbi:MFS transporter [Oenococcus sp. UCMA 17063]|nr:MFS transporter [Oenococcus sp. UCMA 17063]
MRQNKKSLWVVMAFLLASIILGISIYETIPLYADISQLFNVSVYKAIQASSAFSLGYALGFLTVGPLLERFNSRWLLLVSLNLVAIFSILIGAINSFIWLLCLRLFQGIFSSFFAPIAFASVWQLVSEKNIPMANSMITSGFVLASVFGQLFSIIIYQYLGWQGVFNIQAILLVFLAGILFKIMPLIKVPSRHVRYIFALKNIFTNKSLLKQYYVSFILLFSFVSMYSLLSINHLIATNQLVLFRSYGLIGIILAIFSISKMKNASKHSYLCFSLLIVVLGSVTLSFFKQESLLIVASILFSFGIATALPLVVSNIGQISEKEFRPIAVVMYTFVMFIGATFGPIITNYLNQIANITTPFILIAILMIIGAWLEKDF